MLRYILQRVIIFPIALLVANFIGYAYAYYISPIQLARSPYTFGNFTISPVFPEYFNYLKSVSQFDFGVLPQGGSIQEIIVRAGIASLWLLALSLLASIVVGLVLGFSAVRISPPKVSTWLTGMITIGLASPSYYIGIVLIAISIVYVIWGPDATPLFPFQGYGIDAHLVLPTLALMVLPTVKIAQIISTMLVGEMDKQYVVAARSFGHTMKNIRRRLAFRNVLAAVIITVAASLRLMIAELIIIERLFDWPGIGRLFSSTLVLTHRSDFFLFPPLLAALLTLLAAIFLLTDFVAGILVRYFDPRQAG